MVDRKKRFKRLKPYTSTEKDVSSSQSQTFDENKALPSEQLEIEYLQVRGDPKLTVTVTIENKNGNDEILIDSQKLYNFANNTIKFKKDPTSQCLVLDPERKIKVKCEYGMIYNTPVSVYFHQYSVQMSDANPVQG